MIGKAMMLVVALIAFAISGTAGVQELSYDSFNNATNISYDGLNRVAVKNFSTGQHNYTYDADYFGTLTNVTFTNGSVAYGYDDKLRVVREARTLDGLAFEKTFDYDSADRVVRQAGRPGSDVGYAYGSQGMIDRINGFINSTRHNAFGTVLNRTYGSGKATNFTYDSRNARLQRINTDTIQNLLYTYDNVGNIVAINDTANDRGQVMAYDYLDRLINTSINGAQSFQYQYDAIGNMLKIIRDSIAATTLAYGGGPAHAPSRIITGNGSVSTANLAAVNGSNKSKILEFRIVNDGNGSAAAVNWTLNFGDNTYTNSTSNLNLDSGETAFIFAGHDYATGGSYTANATTGSLASPSDYESEKANFGVTISSLEITSRNITNISFRFSLKNDLANEITGVSWQCNNGLAASGITLAGLSNQTIQEVYNYSYSGKVGLNCTVTSTEGNGSASTDFTINGVKIEGYNRTLVDGNTTLIRFNVTNQFYPRVFNYRIASDGQTFTGTTSSIGTNSSIVISQEINYTTAGKKTIDINVTSDKNLTHSLSDEFVLKGVEIEDYHTTNSTSRIIDFLVKSYWPALVTASWNLSDPARSANVNLNASESVMVIIEADYAGTRKPSVNAYGLSASNGLLDRFTAKLLQLVYFQTLTETFASSVSEALIHNTNQSRNVSWQFSTDGYTFTSSNASSLEANETIVLIIESNYTSQGVYNSSLVINSSAANDSNKGVIIT